MQKLSLITGLSVMLLAGCVQKAPQSLITPGSMATAQPVKPVIRAPVQTETTPPVQTVTANNQVKRFQECRNELEAMQVYSKVSYNKYSTEIQTLTDKINRYRKIQEGIGRDINDIVMPQTEFHMRELCFRIKNRLTQLMIRQL